MAAVSRETFAPLLPPAADPDRLQAYHDLLAGAGVERGLIGPREVPRLWDRHLGNSAWVVLPAPGLVPVGAEVADVGSGAGLPGLVWAIVRPDLRVTLIEPLLRRATFLSEAAAELELGDRVAVVRDRAEHVAGERAFDVVTARAVAPLERLLGWTLPLLRDHGQLLALKGQSAEDEIVAARPAVGRLRAGQPRVVWCGYPGEPQATRVVVVPRRAAHQG
jgi:16S rRNA (guanine527-N7)-methyltransferase